MRHIVLALATAVVLVSGCTAVKEPTLDYTPEFSILTKPGINQILESRHARFDLRDHELTRAATGLEGETNLGPMVGNAAGPEIIVELLGPNGTENITTRTFVAATTSISDRYDSLVLWRDFDDPADANAELREGITRWGFLHGDVDSWLENTRDGKDDKRVVSMGVGPAGLVTEVEARLNNGHTLLRYIIHLEDRLYTEEALANIRQFGQSKRPRGR